MILSTFLARRAALLLSAALFSQGPACQGAASRVKAKLNAAMVAALNDPQVRPKLLEQGFEIVASTPEQMAKFQADEFTRWKAVIETSKFTAD
jgi:tripartite-type tricarboxylate transporter receptor subunit TctC